MYLVVILLTLYATFATLIHVDPSQWLQCWVIFYAYEHGVTFLISFSKSIFSMLPTLFKNKLWRKRIDFENSPLNISSTRSCRWFAIPRTINVVDRWRSILYFLDLRFRGPKKVHPGLWRKRIHRSRIMQRGEAHSRLFAFGSFNPPLPAVIKRHAHHLLRSPHVCLVWIRKNE